MCLQREHVSVKTQGEFIVKLSDTTHEPYFSISNQVTIQDGDLLEEGKSRKLCSVLLSD